MKTRNYLAIATTATLLFAPGFSFADGDHSYNGEIPPGHFSTQSNTTRSEVIAVLDAAHKDGTHQMTNNGVLPLKQNSPAKSRESVMGELTSMSAAERDDLRQYYMGSN